MNNIKYLQNLYEYDISFFNYVYLEKDLWNDLIRKTQKEFNVYFDLENNDTMKVQRIIIVPQTQWDFTECKFKCELFQAGGDWETATLYFRCQLVDGYAFNLSKYNQPHFIFIPNKKEGNYHLKRGEKDRWYPSDNNDHIKNIDPEANEKKCWESLKIYLEKLVNMEIEKLNKEKNESLSELKGFIKK